MERDHLQPDTEIPRERPSDNAVRPATSIEGEPAATEIERETPAGEQAAEAVETVTGEDFEGADAA